MNWETLEFHPLADAFPLMDKTELEELAVDILKNGQLEPIVIYQGKILDGRNRFLACKMEGIEPSMEHYAPAFTDQTPSDYVWSMNVQRRHLRADQKREVIAKLLKADPTKSNRRIADIAKVDHKTAGAVRTELEAREEIPHVPKTTDTKGRRQPVNKPKPKPTETGEKAIHLSSRIEDLVTKWHNERKPDVWFRVHDEYEFKIRQVPPLVDAKSETGRAVRERQAAK